MATDTSDFGRIDDARGAKTVSRVSWGAIFAGVVIVIAIQVVLGILGTGIGLSLVNPEDGTTPGAQGFGIGAGIYWILTTVIALGVGGYATARVAGVHDRFEGLVHGLVVWGVTLILTLYLLTSAVGSIIGGAFNTIGSAASAAGSGITSAVPAIADAANVDTDDVKDEASSYLSSAPSDPAQMTPEQARTQIARELPDLAQGGEAGTRAESRIVDIVAAQRGIPRAEAQAEVSRAKARFERRKNEAAETARSAADTAASAGAGTSFMIVIALLIGAAASGFGAAAATRRRI